MNTLGWLAAEWMFEHLPSPADPARPLELVDWQLDALLEWYRFDESLAFVHRRGSLMEPKGAGKSPLGAFVCLFEFAGPAIPDGIDAKGRPVGRPWGSLDAPPAWVQVAGVAEDAAASNVYALLFEALSVNGGKAARDLGIDEGRTRLYLKDRPASKLEAVTASAGSREGQRVTFGLLDETMLWTPTSGGTKLARTIWRNAGKTKGRALELTNAPALGEGSVAERTMTDAEQDGIMLLAPRPSTMPDPQMPDAQLLGLLGEVYAGCPWIDLDRIMREVRDPATPWDEAVRYYFNVASRGASSLVDPVRWDDLTADRKLEPGQEVWLGFVASAAGASLVAFTDDGLLAPLLQIERDGVDPPNWRVPRVDVQDAIASAFVEYRVVRLIADPHGWRDEVAEWSATHGEDRVLEFPTNSVRRLGPAVDRFREAVAEGRVHHEGDRHLTAHVLNARLHRSRTRVEDHDLFTLEKPAPGRLIDGAVASVLAYEAHAQAPPPPSRELMMAWA